MTDDQQLAEAMAQAMCLDVDPDEKCVCRAHPMGVWLDDGEPYWHGFIDAATAALAAYRTFTQERVDDRD
jgi:hypothetical protein